MSRKARKRRLFSIMIIILLIFICFGIVRSVKMRNQIKTMDKIELHYDADSWFIMVDKEYDLVGIYFATTPIAHVYCDTDKFDRGVINIPALIYGGESKMIRDGYEDYIKPEVQINE